MVNDLELLGLSHLSEEEALDNLLNKHFPISKVKKSGNALYCLDAMCGMVWQGEKIYSFLESNYSKVNLLGVDIKAAKWCEELINSYNPNLKLINQNILETKGDYDLILTLRPNCYFEVKMIDIYSHLNLLLKKEGLLFGATYTGLEMESLQIILEASGFKIDEPFKIDNCGLKYGYAIIAKKE
jgi:hypothetical protein